MRLQKAAASLLSFFELKVDGGNPPQFGDAVQPVIEIAEFYSAGQQLTVQQTSNVTAVDDQVVHTVPAGTAYRVRAVGFQLVLAAATTGVDGAGGAVLYNPGNTGAVLYELHSTPKVTAANNWQLQGGALLPKPFIALPGTKLFYNNDRIYSVASPCTLRMLVDVLQYP